MPAFVEWLGKTTGEVVGFRLYTDKIFTSDSEVCLRQDADIIFRGKTYPFEVKVTKGNFSDTIFLKAPVIERIKDSNGKVLISEKEIFATMDCKDVVKLNKTAVRMWRNTATNKSVYAYVLWKGNLVFNKYLKPLDI